MPSAFDASQLPADDPLIAEMRETFSQYMTGALVLEEVAAAIADIIAQAVSGATRAEIIAVAQDAANLLIENVDATTARGIAQTLAEGLEQQLGVPATARRVRANIGLTPSQVKSLAKLEEQLKADGLAPEVIDGRLSLRRDEMIAERAQVIAQTEMRNAVEAGELQVQISRGSTHKMSISVGDDRVSEICRGAEADGPIPVDQLHSSGAPHPPHHPRCRCTEAYVDEKTPGALDRARGRQEVRIAETANALAEKEKPKREFATPPA